MAGEYVEFVNNSQPALNEDNLNLMQQRIKQDIQGAVSGDTLPVGAIMPFGSDTIPENWLLCNGQAVSRTDYQDLFNTIGITYGQGDGFTTFNLPNLQGKVVVGKDGNDEDFDTLGKAGGEKEHTLTIEEMPAHTHTGVPKYYRASIVEQGTENNSQTGSQGSTSSAGEGQPHNILQPYQVQNYIIKAKQSAGVVATVVDSLNSTSTTDALSANQGKILNEKFNYSTTEKQIATWIDGKPIYRKVVEIGSLPNDTTVNYAHGISNLNRIINLTASWYDTEDTRWRTNPRYSFGSNVSITITCDDTNVIVQGTGTDWSSRTNSCIAILEYTKTTD